MENLMMNGFCELTEDEMFNQDAGGLLGDIVDFFTKLGDDIAAGMGRADGYDDPDNLVTASEVTQAGSELYFTTFNKLRNKFLSAFH